MTTKSLKGLIGAGTAAIALFSAIGTASADNFSPYMTLGAGGGNVEGLGSAGLYLPWAASDESGAALFYFQTSYDTDDNWAGSLGFGYRWAAGSMSVIGLGAHLDMKHSGYNNTFFQGRLSGDLAIGGFNAVTNVYIPFESSDGIGKRKKTFFWHQYGREYTMWGTDLKLAYDFEVGPETAFSPFVKVSYFDAYRKGGSHFFGYEVGAAFKIWDVDFLGLNGSQLKAEASFRDEFSGRNVRRDEGFAGLTLTLPFASGERTERQSWRARNIIRPFEADRDVVVTNARANGKKVRPDYYHFLPYSLTGDAGFGGLPIVP